MGKGGSNEVKETENEKAAAEVAAQQWDLYKNELRPYENLFMDKVDALNNEQKYSDIANATSLGYQSEFGKARQDTATQLAAGGMDPSSGKFQGTLDNITSDQVASQIDTTNRAQSTQADKYVAGLQDVFAMGAGQKADAMAGFNSIANSSMQKAQSDAQRSMGNRQATTGLAGALGGAAVRTYGLRDAAPSVGSGSNGVFGGSSSGGQFGVSNTPFGKTTFK